MERIETPTGEYAAEYTSAIIVDVQRKHATYLKTNGNFNVRYDLSHYTPQNLERLGR